MKRKWFSAACAVLMATGSVAAGCGSDDDGESGTSGAASANSTASGDGGGADASALKKELDSWYTGERFGEPPTEPNPVVKDKSVWLIACANVIVSCTNVWDIYERNAKAAGWKVTRVDGKQNPTVQNNAIRQAVAAKADVIGLSSIDCSVTKGPLAEAKKAGIAIVASTGLDCDPSVFDASNVANGTETFEEALEQLGGIEGLAVANELQPKGGGRVIVQVNPFTEAGNAITKGAKDALSKWCPKCEVTDLVLNAPDFVPPKAQQKAQSILTRYPDAKALVALSDDVVLAGIGPAIQAARPDDKALYVASGASATQGIKLMQQGSPQIDFNVGISAEGRGDELFDASLSLLKDEEPVPAGNAWQAFDKERGLPKGADYVAPVDFKSTYFKRWGLTP